MKREAALYFREKSNWVIMTLLFLSLLVCMVSSAEEAETVYRLYGVIYGFLTYIPLLLELLIIMNIGKEYSNGTYQLRRMQMPLWKIFFCKFCLSLLVMTVILLVFSGYMLLLDLAGGAKMTVIFCAALDCLFCMILAGILTGISKNMLVGIAFAVFMFLGENVLYLSVLPKNIILQNMGKLL